MTKNIYVNLPVRDLNNSKEFFSKLGFKFNPVFTNEQAACMIIGKNIFAMLIVHKRFKDFIKKNICDAKKHTEVLISLDARSKEEVKRIITKALALGGKPNMPAADHGWMYQHSFQDLDGHIWEVGYMNLIELNRMMRKTKTKSAGELAASKKR